MEAVGQSPAQPDSGDARGVFGRGVAFRQPWSVFVRTVGRELTMAAAQVLVAITILVYQAYRTMHAIVVTLIRLGAAEGRLLEWETAARVARHVRGFGVARFLLEMAVSPTLALALLIAIFAFRPDAMLAAIAFLALWLA